MEMFSKQANQQVPGLTARRTIAGGGGREKLEKMEQLRACFRKDAEELIKFYGRAEIDKIYRATKRSLPKKYKGKQAKRDRNTKLLAACDAVAAEQPDEINSIPRIVAQQLKPNSPAEARSLERQIRRLRSERACAWKKAEELRRLAHRTIAGACLPEFRTNRPAFL